MIPKNKFANKIYIYILGYYNDNDYFPTLQEIANNFTNKNTGETYTKEWARQMCNELVKQGKITIDKRKWRGIRLTNGA